MPDKSSGRYEVKTILEDDTTRSTFTDRSQKKFFFYSVGYEEITWELLTNLSCRGLFFDYLRRKKRDNRLQRVKVSDDRNVNDTAYFFFWRSCRRNER